MTKSQAREQAFVLLYMKTFQPELDYDALAALAAESEFIRENRYTKTLFELAEAHAAESEAAIAPFFRGWRWERLPRLTAALFHLCVGELLFEEGLPTYVAVNEAVELAKKYISAEDASFVNGALRSLLRSREA